MDSAKVDAVMQWPELQHVKDIQAFLGFANFYQHFINNFFKLAQSLTKLLCKDAPWEQVEAQGQAFQRLKQAFISAPILIMADPAKSFTLEYNALDYAIGAVLSQ